ncbi:MAG: UDP-N-acetylmuramoyl-tripeptide--D-alanyl-D-alanine ligase [Leptolyngbya sp. PLA1]|nr:UDP-N-acetylmuramoyl-tripeptide--D-alanyl-D-alanine ligase [Leptolyngbya sp. PLA1]
MTFWTPDSVRSAIGGSWLERPDTSAPAVELFGASTDSRTLTPGQVFFALRTEKADGHAYIRDALLRGAGLVVVDRPESVLPLDSSTPARGVLRVPDVRAALLRLAAAYRRSFERTRVIAVGGSNGKTTTVRLLEQVLGRHLRGSASPKSFNNDLGVPLTVLGAKRTDQFLICEVGTNAPGELRPLAEALAPDIGVITSIGREHLEGFGSIEGVVREEASLAAGLREGGVLIHSSDSPELRDAARPLLAAQQAISLTFGMSAEADLRVSAVSTGMSGTAFTLNERETFRVGLLGAHNALNAAAVVAVARRLGLSHEEIRAGLAAARGAPMRLEPVESSGVWFLNDAYNANPESMLAALRTFDEACAGFARRVVVLGDMLEQGDAGPRVHAEIGAAVAGAAPDLAVFVGPLMAHAADAARAWPGGPARSTIVTIGSARGEDVGRIASLLRPGDAVLLKGSRGMSLERVLAAHSDAHRSATPDADQPAPHHP